MSQQHDVVAFHARKDRRETRIIEHHVTSIGIPKAHADVLPDLHPHGALLDCAVHLLERLIGPVRRLKILDGEGTGEGYPAGITSLESDRVALLFGERRKVRIVDVDGEDVHVVGHGLRHEPVAAAVDMHVCVDLLNAGKVGGRVVLIAGSGARCERAPGRHQERGERRRAARAGKA